LKHPYFKELREAD